MNCKGRGTKQFWTKSIYSPDIFLQRQRKATKTLISKCRLPGFDLKQETPEYVLKCLQHEPTCQVHLRHDVRSNHFPKSFPSEIIQRFKKRVTDIKGYITHLNEPRSPSRHISRNHCLLRYGRCSCDLYGRWPMWFSRISPQLSVFRRTQVRTLSKILGFTLIFTHL